MIAEVYLCMGRFHLEVAGTIVATQGDVCRDANVPVLGDDYESPMIRRHIERCWTEERLKWVRDRINERAHQNTG